MMSHFLRSLLLLVFLTGGAVMLVKASDNVIRCEHDNFCQATQKLMTVVSVIKNQLDERGGVQATDLEELKVKLDRSLATSTAVISTQLEKHSGDLLSVEERLKAQNVHICPDMNAMFDKLGANASDIYSKQVKDVEELKAKLDRSLASTAAIFAQLEKLSANLLRHDERLQVHDVSQTDLQKSVQKLHDSLIGPEDCSDIRAMGFSTSGVYRVYPGSLAKRIQADVYCDMTTTGGNWLVFQRRKDGSVNFERTWNEYLNGFGNQAGEFWFGNELLYLLTSNRKYKLRIDMEDFDGQKRYAEYSTFSISSSADRYRLKVSGYTGNAGDSFSGRHSGMQFSTKEVDNDIYPKSCALLYRGAWWYSNCHDSNLNGLYLGGPHTTYAVGINWRAFRGHNYSLKMTEMKIAIAD